MIPIWKTFNVDGDFGEYIINRTCFLFGCPKLAPKYNKFFSETIVETINCSLFFIVYLVFFLTLDDDGFQEA